MRYVLFSILGCLGLFVGPAFHTVPFSVHDDDPPKLTVPEGFQAEILYHPTAADSSSWVALAMDPQGRLLASDQHGALYRIQPAALGSDPATTRVEKLDIAIGHANGLLWAFNSLYVVVNSEEGLDGRGSGLYRVLDSDGDDQFDTIHTLATFEGFGEHGPHSVILGPDGSSLFLVAGNHTELPTSFQALVPPVWQEDQVLPALRDPRGHASDRTAPGGWIARTDSLGRHWDLVSVGFRNAFDIAFNTAGDLFTFDSDMEQAPGDLLLLSDSVTMRSERYGPAITDMRANRPQPQEIDVVMSLRHVRTGWTLAQRETYFQWFYDALRKSGGRSYVGFLENIRADALEHVPQTDREALADLTDSYSAQALNLADLPQPEGPGRNWNRKEIYLLMEDELAKPRNLDQGRRMYAAALCQACHTLRGVGGAIGPDLTQVGTRFSRGDILEAIDSPSDAISDQYAAALLTTMDGKTFVGRVVGDDDEVVMLNQNPYMPEQQIRVPKANITQREASSVSIMPPRLLNRLNGQEVMDIMAYLLSGGDPKHPCYTHERGCLYDKDD